MFHLWSIWTLLDVLHKCYQILFINSDRSYRIFRIQVPQTGLCSTSIHCSTPGRIEIYKKRSTRTNWVTAEYQGTYLHTKWSRFTNSTGLSLVSLLFMDAQTKQDQRSTTTLSFIHVTCSSSQQDSQQSKSRHYTNAQTMGWYGKGMWPKAAYHAFDIQRPQRFLSHIVLRLLW